MGRQIERIEELNKKIIISILIFALFVTVIASLSSGANVDLIFERLVISLFVFWTLGWFFSMIINDLSREILFKKKTFNSEVIKVENLEFYPKMNINKIGGESNKNVVVGNKIYYGDENSDIIKGLIKEGKSEKSAFIEELIKENPERIASLIKGEWLSE